MGKDHAHLLSDQDEYVFLESESLDRERSALQVLRAFKREFLCLEALFYLQTGLVKQPLNVLRA